MGFWDFVTNFLKNLSAHSDQFVPEVDKGKVNMDVTTAMEILSLATEHGIPAMLEIMKVWKDDTPVTVDTIKNATLKLQSAESYFKKDEAETAKFDET